MREAQLEVKMLAGKREEAARALRFVPEPHRHWVTWRVVQLFGEHDAQAHARARTHLAPLDYELRRLGLVYAASLTDHVGDVEPLWRWHIDTAPTREQWLNSMQALVWMSVALGNAEQAWTDLRAMEREDASGRLQIRVLLAALPWLPAETVELEHTLDLYGSWDPRALFPRGSQRTLQIADRARAFLCALISHRLHALPRQSWPLPRRFFV